MRAIPNYVKQAIIPSKALQLSLSTLRAPLIPRPFLLRADRRPVFPGHLAHRVPKHLGLPRTLDRLVQRRRLNLLLPCALPSAR